MLSIGSVLVFFVGRVCVWRREKGGKGREEKKENERQFSPGK